MRGVAAHLDRRLCRADVARRLQAGARQWCSAGRSMRRPISTGSLPPSSSNAWTCLQAAHTWSGIEMALWDILGRKRDAPVYELLGYRRAYPKLPYASQLFGDTPAETLAGCRSARDKGYRAVKCGWGPFGRGSLDEDRDHLQAAREGLGARRHAADRCRPDLPRGCRGGSGAHHDAGRGRRDLAGGTVPRRRL